MLLINLALVVMLLAFLPLNHTILASMLHIYALYLHNPPMVTVNQQIVLPLCYRIMLVRQT
jgi:hypothetical protein